MMKRRHTTRPEALAALALLALTACSGPDDSSPADNGEATSTASTTTTGPVTDEIDDRFGLPPEARTAAGGGDPREPSYWLVWNTCAPDNRADEAADNGGRAAGFVLVDDILAEPGIALGEHLLTTCEESVALLGGQTVGGEATDDPAYALAQQLLAAELNLNVGAETCPAAEEAVVGAQIVLSAAAFDGASTGPLDAEATGALPDLIDLLVAYNTGQLCR